MSKAHGLDRVLSLVTQPWAITEDMLCLIAQVLHRRLTAGPHTADVEAIAAAQQLRDERPVAPSNVAVLALHGCLIPRGNLLADVSGAATFEGATQALNAVVDDPRVSAVVLDFDSPGGSVHGARMFAHSVLRARTKKPIVAQVYSVCCSAAYWAAACATEIVAVPDAHVGSIGVYLLHKDLSAALSQDGIKVTLVSAGEHKTDGNPFEPLSEAAHARMKTLVQGVYSHFVADVAAGRGLTAADVRDGYGKGDVVTADEALALGMIDRIATPDETLARLGASPASSRVAVAAIADTSQEPSATDQDRVTARREMEHALLALL